MCQPDKHDLNKWIGTGLAFKPGHLKDVELFLDEKMLTLPLRWKKPRRIFVCSMTDLFAEFVPDEFIDKMFAVMALAPQHTFQVLTKRAARMQAYMCASDMPSRVMFASLAFQDELPSEGSCWDIINWHFAKLDPRDLFPLKNVWLGVSTERQQEADERIPLLLQTPAAIRFISAEPLLGPIDLIGTLARFQDDPIAKRQCAVPLGRQLIDWVIVGGESGRGARPMHPDWARSLRDQCAAAGIAFFFKQWGEWGPDDFSDQCVRGGWLSQDGTLLDDFLDVQKSNCQKPCLLIFRLGKKVADRHLDGELHNAMPAVRT